MLERAITEMVTVPSKLAETWEPFWVIRTPVVLNTGKSGREGTSHATAGMTLGPTTQQQ